MIALCGQGALTWHLFPLSKNGKSEGDGDFHTIAPVPNPDQPEPKRKLATKTRRHQGFLL
jgi:hypothetical protein